MCKYNVLAFLSTSKPLVKLQCVFGAHQCLHTELIACVRGRLRGKDMSQFTCSELPGSSSFWISEHQFHFCTLVSGRDTDVMGITGVSGTRNWWNKLALQSGLKKNLITPGRKYEDKKLAQRSS